MKKNLLKIAFIFALIGAAPGHDVKLWRMDCGSFTIPDLNAFSDVWGYTGRSKTLTDSCYLIRHDGQYMIWDTGLGVELIKHPSVIATGLKIWVTTTLVAQLDQLGIKPEDVTIVALSHNHGDHIGQAAFFPKAKLLIGRKDWDALTAKVPATGLEPDRLKPWIEGGAPKELVDGDKDIFGDGSVVMFATPGHTPDHHSLLVRLKNKGAVLLSGDLYHFREQRERNGVPPYNASRADTLASFDRFNAIAKNLNASVIIQHEPEDVDKLPLFPAGAD